MIINFEEYRKHLEEEKKAKNTIRSYMTNLKQLDDYRVANGYEGISPVVSDSYKEHMLGAMAYKPSTVNNKVITLNTYFNYLKKEKRVRKTRKLKLKTEKIQNMNDREYLVKSEYEALYKACRHPQTKLLMKLISQTGLRITEATDLTLKRIEPNIIPIKNKGKWRTIGMKDELKSEINEFFKGKEPNEKLFSFSQTTYRNRMTEAALIAKIDKNKVYPHAFRHYFAKEFLRNATDQRALRMLQVILGHSNISTTMIYLQFNNSEIVEMMMA